MLKHRPVEDRGLRLAIEAAGGSKYALAKLLGVTPQSLNTWRRIPVQRLVDVERATGIPREKLYPELYVGMTRRQGGK